MPEGDLPGVGGDGTSKSAVSRPFVALSRKKMKAWLASDLGLLETSKTCRRLKACRQLPILRNALQEHPRKAQADSAIETIMTAA